MKIIIGLGNPGKEYAKTRHNAGWLFLDYLANIYNINIAKSNCDCLIGEGRVNNEKIVLAKPLTFMNLSGNAVSKLKKWYKVENKDMLIIFDDVDIPFGTFRYKEKGSGGSHNGMKSVVESLSSQDIARLRIGTGGLKHEKQDMSDFVLSNFKKDELEKLDDVFVDASHKVADFLQDSVDNLQ